MTGARNLAGLAELAAPGTATIGEIAPGDTVVADPDAVIVLRPGQVANILENGRERVSREDKMMARIRAGETTLQVLGLGSKEV